MNACRPEYRNLSAARECELRNIRMRHFSDGVLERPGKLPYTGSTGTMIFTTDELRAKIMDAAETELIRAELIKRVGNNNRIHGLIALMVADGSLIERKARTYRYYRSAK